MRLGFKLKKIAISLAKKKQGPVALTLHHVSDGDFDWLAEFIDGLLEQYRFCHPDEAISRKGIGKKSLILTLDDGLLSQKRFANEILDPRDIKAIFFIPTSFVGRRGGDALEFAKKHFFPFGAPKDRSAAAYDAMSLSDLRSLLDNGHSIGGHTYSHPILSSLTPEEQYREIVESADVLSENLGVPIQQFAYPFGSIQAVSENSVKIANERFHVSYSNIRGMLNEQLQNNFLFRQNIVPGMPNWMAQAAVEGRLDWRHAISRSLAH